jgi:RimJ/RimL family protein N-acetyltransferase
VDNAAMRRVFEACGWVKEAHHRKAWRGFDAIGYAIPREDWESGRVTPVPW